MVFLRIGFPTILGAKAQQSLYVDVLVVNTKLVCNPKSDLGWFEGELRTTESKRIAA